MALLEEAVESLERMQNFDPSTLVRVQELGTAKNFANAVLPAQRLIDLYRRLSPRALEDFPDDKLNQVKERANSDHQLFQQILQFDADRTTADRDALIASVTKSYTPLFNTLHPLIAYSLHRSADFQRLDSEARATLQSVQDRAQSLTKDLETAKGEATRILEEVRATAAEAGVSQQALFFKESADAHEAEATSWRKITVRLAWATGLFALASMTIHKIPFLRPETTYDTVQIAVSKVLVFGVLTYMLYLAAKNFLSHKHNAIINRHRQQALQTFQALVDAAADSGKSDIVLTHAASCIFTPQATGYAAESSGNAPPVKTVVELLGSSVAKSTSAT